jgi:thioesterase domain-containing protein
VVFFHTWTTEAAHKLALGEVLGEDQPLYGIEPPRLEDGPLPTSTAEWVAFHREAFDRLPVEAPYRLAGFSFGGVIALEIARQLRAEGREVEWLGLIDSLRPKLNPRGARRYIEHHLAETLALPTERRSGYVKGLVVSGSRRTRLRVKGRAQNLLVRVRLKPPRPTSLGDQLGLTPLKRSVFRSYLSYWPTPYDAPVALFVAAGTVEKASGDASLRWAPYLRGGFELTHIEGGHLDLFGPSNVHSVGGAIEASLLRADAEARRRSRAVACPPRDSNPEPADEERRCSGA